MKTYNELIEIAAGIRIMQKENAKLFGYTARDKAEDAMFMQGYMNAITDMFEDWLEDGIGTVREDIQKKVAELKQQNKFA